MPHKLTRPLTENSFPTGMKNSVHGSLSRRLVRFASVYSNGNFIKLKTQLQTLLGHLAGKWCMKAVLHRILAGSCEIRHEYHKFRIIFRAWFPPGSKKDLGSWTHCHICGFNVFMIYDFQFFSQKQKRKPPTPFRRIVVYMYYPDILNINTRRAHAWEPWFALICDALFWTRLLAWWACSCRAANCSTCARQWTLDV